MVDGFDMGTIQGLNGLGGKGGSAGKSPMNGGKAATPPKAPEINSDPNAVYNPLAAGTTTEGGAAGSTDLGQQMGADGGRAAPTGAADTSGGLGEMGSKDKLNMIAKLYGGGMGIA